MGGCASCFWEENVRKDNIFYLKPIDAKLIMNANNEEPMAVFPEVVQDSSYESQQSDKEKLEDVISVPHDL